MAKSCLTMEELTANFPTVEDLMHQRGVHNPKKWGLLSNGKGECRFGVPDEMWGLEVSLHDILRQTKENCRNVGPGRVYFIYTVDAKTCEIECCSYEALGVVLPTRTLKKRQSPVIKH